VENFIQKEALFKQGKYIELKKGEVLHNSHDTCLALGRVERGRLRLSRVLSSGKEIVLKEFYPGEVFGELLVFTQEKYPGWLIASESSLVVEVGFSRLLKYVENKKALISFISGISRKMTHLTNTIEIMSLKTVKQKIAFFLLSQGKAGVKFPLNVSHLAVRLGCSREALSRALTEMESERMIARERGFFRIAHEELLENLF
jgi:CRP/FNR family transcriptional regulator